ncbi:MAG: site-specific integrase [Oscillospiraceae bacterium]|nr:site-specific integrase [Oscillospiraceae bacterium]
MASIRENKTKVGTSFTVLYDYEDGNGRRKQKSAGTFASRREAEGVQLEIELSKNRSNFIEPNDITVRELFDRWLPIRAKTKRWEASTYSSSLNMIEKHILPRIGTRQVQGINVIHIETLFAELENTRCSGPQTKNVDAYKLPFLSSSTISSIYMLLRCAFEAAVKWKLIHESPVQMDKPVRVSPEANFWTQDQMYAALERIEDPLLHLCVHMSLACTLREGEVSGLRMDRVDLEDGTVTVDATMQRVPRKAFDLLPQKEIYFVYPQFAGQSDSVLLLKSPYRDFGLLICQEDGTPAEPNLVGKWFRLWQRRSGGELPYLKYHELRHSSATLLYDLCRNAKSVQGITGHASAKMVLDVYGHKHQQQQVSLTRQLESTLYSCQTAPKSPDERPH